MISKDRMTTEVREIIEEMGVEGKNDITRAFSIGRIMEIMDERYGDRVDVYIVKDIAKEILRI